MRNSSTPSRFRSRAVAVASLVLFCLTASVCQAQSHDVVCSAGTGTFESAFRTGVKVSVIPARNGELATRVCKAELSWNKQKLVISAGAPRIDVDAFGADLGLGAPVAAIQVKESDADCCMSYQIYSLLKPPRLLRTITGADSFGAADADLDGRVEIWTDDSAAVDGFERFDVKQLDFAPPIVLRFTNGQLLDVSAEFQPYFDQQIANARVALTAQKLSDFKNSDGRLALPAPSSLEDLRYRDYLLGIKLKVLKIVWSHVHSVRHQEACHFPRHVARGRCGPNSCRHLAGAASSGDPRHVDGGGTGSHQRPERTRRPSSTEFALKMACPTIIPMAQSRREDQQSRFEVRTRPTSTNPIVGSSFDGRIGGSGPGSGD